MRVHQHGVVQLAKSGSGITLGYFLKSFSEALAFTLATLGGLGRTLGAPFGENYAPSMAWRNKLVGGSPWGVLFQLLALLGYLGVSLDQLWQTCI
jgi:hypothetical protein